MSTPDRSDDYDVDLAERRRQENAPLEEAGEGESEGFELAERDLVEHASHGDQHSTQPIVRDSWDEVESDESGAEYGEPDSEDVED